MSISPQSRLSHPSLPHARLFGHLRISGESILLSSRSTLDRYRSNILKLDLTSCPSHTIHPNFESATTSDALPTQNEPKYTVRCQDPLPRLNYYVLVSAISFDPQAEVERMRSPGVLATSVAFKTSGRSRKERNPFLLQQRYDQAFWKSLGNTR